jgi:hypothetical protein
MLEKAKIDQLQAQCSRLWVRNLTPGCCPAEPHAHLLDVPRLLGFSRPSSKSVNPCSSTILRPLAADSLAVEDAIFVPNQEARVWPRTIGCSLSPVGQLIFLPVSPILSVTGAVILKSHPPDCEKTLSFPADCHFIRFSEKQGEIYLTFSEKNVFFCCQQYHLKHSIRICGRWTMSKKRNRGVKTIAACTGAVMLAGGLVTVQAAPKAISKGRVVKSGEQITGAKLNSYQLLQVCSDKRGRISVADASKLLNLTADEVTKLKALADKRGTVSYRDAVKVFHSTKPLRQVSVATVIETIKKADTTGAFAEIEELAKGRRELTADTRSKLTQKYGISNETLAVYYNIASSVSKMPSGAQIGAIM